MKVSSVTVAKLNEEKKFTAIIGTTAIKAGKKLNERDTKIAEAFRKFDINTQKTSGEFVNAAKVKDDFIRMNDAVTDREIMRVAHYLQSEQIGIISRKNKKGEYFYTRLDWTEFVALDISARVISIDEQKKSKIERDAKQARKTEEQKIANAREILVKAGYTEKEIESILAQSNVAETSIDVTPMIEKTA